MEFTFKLKGNPVRNTAVWRHILGMSWNEARTCARTYRRVRHWRYMRRHKHG